MATTLSPARQKKGLFGPIRVSLILGSSVYKAFIHIITIVKFRTGTQIQNKVMFGNDLRSNIDLDISLAHPWRSEIFLTSAGKAGAAVSQQKLKKATYDQLKLPRTSTINIIPLVLKHFKTWEQPR